MPPSKRQLHIIELVRSASVDESRFDNPLLRREHSPVARLKAIEKLLRIQGGIGGQTQRVVKKIGREIEVIAKQRLASGEFAQADYDELIDRLEMVRARLQGMPEIRAQKCKEKEQLEEAVKTAIPPFDLKDATPLKERGFAWKKTITKDGEINFFLVVPTQKFRVWTKEEYENLRRRAGTGTNATAETGSSSTAATNGCSAAE
jgi:hypothetical protein